MLCCRKKLPKEFRYAVPNIKEHNEYGQSKYSKVIEESHFNFTPAYSSSHASHFQKFSFLKVCQVS